MRAPYHNRADLHVPGNMMRRCHKIKSAAQLMAICSAARALARLMHHSLGA
jgi:hypothetical protein